MSEYEEYRKMVKEMLDSDDKGFTDWEISFLESTYKQTKYSEKQINVIEKIYRSKM